MKTKHAVLIEPGRFEIEETDITPKSDQVLAKVAVCGLCNHELNHWKGILGTCPQTLGHEWAGTVVETGLEVKHLKPGDRITIFPEVQRDGFAEYAVIREQHCAKVSEEIDLKYALGEPLKCIVTVLRGTAPEAGDHGVVLGCGPMGLWCIQALSGHLLSSLVAVDIDDAKLSLASRFGATHVCNPRKRDAATFIQEVTQGAMADFVVEGTGVSSLLNTALSYVKPAGRGRLVLMSAYEAASRDFDIREAIRKSAQIVVPHPLFAANPFDDFARAISLINNGTFRVKDLISHEFKLEDIQKAFETLENKPEGYLKGIVIP